MIEIIKNKQDIENFFSVLKERSSTSDGKYIQTVKEIIDDVRKNQDKALLKYTRQFDDENFNIEDMEVSLAEQEKAFDSLSDKMKQVLYLSLIHISEPTRH